jgi:general secretion pathway protein I
LSTSREAGFTLLEVLVAFVIAALAFTVLFKAVGSGVGTASTAGRYEEATARARSHLAATGRENLLSATTLNGDDGAGYHWRIAVDPIASTKPIADEQDAEETPNPPQPIGLFRVTVSISWNESGRTREVSLQTQRVAPLSKPTP